MGAVSTKAEISRKAREIEKITEQFFVGQQKSSPYLDAAFRLQLLLLMSNTELGKIINSYLRQRKKPRITQMFKSRVQQIDSCFYVAAMLLNHERDPYPEFMKEFDAHQDKSALELASGLLKEAVGWLDETEKYEENSPDKDFNVTQNQVLSRECETLAKCLVSEDPTDITGEAPVYLPNRKYGGFKDHPIFIVRYGYRFPICLYTKRIDIRDGKEQYIYNLKNDPTLGLYCARAHSKHFPPDAEVDEWPFSEDLGRRGTHGTSSYHEIAPISITLCMDFNEYPWYLSGDRAGTRL